MNISLNSIIIQAKLEDICEGANPKGDIQLLGAGLPFYKVVPLQVA